MDASHRATGRTVRLAAAASAAIVTVGLVSAPSNGKPLVRPAAAIPVQTLAVDLTSAALDAATPATAPSRATAPVAAGAGAGAKAKASLSPVESVVFTALYAIAEIALTPLWYIAFPVTLPLSFVGAVLLAGFMAGSRPISDAEVALWGIGIYALGPPALIVGTLSLALQPITKPTAAESDSTPAADSTERHTSHRENSRRGVAGSRRTAGTSTSVDRAPAAHRTAKTTPKAATEKKHSGTARSARPAGTRD